MSHHTNADGSVLLTDPTDPTRTQLIPAGASGEDIAAAVTAFFANMPKPVPAVVSMAKARIALDAAGLLAGVEAAVLAAPNAVKLAWEYSTEIHRHSPTMLALAAALGLSEAQVDDLFRAAEAVVL